jgi:hypothetical protein
MNFDSMPIVRLEIDRMKASIVHHLGVNGSQYGEALAAAIDNAVKSYDWDSQVKELTHKILEEKIADYFKYGNGAQAIREAVNAGFENIL